MDKDRNLFGQAPWARRGEAAVAAAEAVSAAVPVGAITAYWGTTAPAGWLLCDGSAIPAQYSALIALIGPNTPNLKGRVIVGLDAAQTEFDTLGETGGSKTSTAPHSHAHTHGSYSANTAAASVGHSHDYFLPQFTNVTVQSGTGNGGMWGGALTATASSGQSATHVHPREHTHAPDSAASSAAAASGNLQPYAAVPYIIRAAA